METKEEYAPDIIRIESDFSLVSKDEGWKPSKSIKSSLESVGYTVGATIGDGLYSKVKRAHCSKLMKDVAIKIIQKKRISPDVLNKFIPREVALMQKLQHDSLVVLHAVYDTTRMIYMVMEYLPNGDLLEYINRFGALPEVDTRRIMHQLLNVVAYLHDNHVYHRDIKLDNILLDEHYNIRLGDFGFARYNPSDDLLKTYCGSYAYAAPEILNGENYIGSQVDVWSMGVCMYTMLNGRLPFRDDDLDVLRLAQQEKVKFYKHVGKDGRDLLREFLNVLPNRRITIPAVRRSLWMCRPMKSQPQSMSCLSATAVASNFLKNEKFDPRIEHGFACDQKTKEVTPKKVSSVLKAVAINHSIGESSIDLEEIVPSETTSSVALVTGVNGPVGRRISSDLGITSALELAAECETSADSGDARPMFGDQTEKSRTGKKPFHKARKAVSRFKAAAKSIYASKRNEQGPITTILKIPQEKAMEKMIKEKHKIKVREMRLLRYCTSGKVARSVTSGSKSDVVLRQRSLTSQKSIPEIRKKRRNMWDVAVSVFGPDND